MKILATGFAVWCLSLGLIEGNILDDIILNNWRDKGPVVKRNDPFFNPFGIPFPFFGEVPAEEPPIPDMKASDMKIPDLKVPDVKTPEVNVVDVKAPKVDGGHSVAKRSVERMPKGKPWFSVSDFLSFPETSRAHHKLEAAGQDKISQTGDLEQTPKPVESGLIKLNGHIDDRQRNLIVADDVHKRVEDRDWAIKNDTKTNKSLPRAAGSSFPKGLSDILIIFQKVGPKTRSHPIIQTSAHSCDGFNCYDSVCDFKKPEIPEEHTEEHAKKNSSILEHVDRLFLLIIPIGLGIGTVFFVLELRRIYRKMKKQAIVTSFQHQEC